MTDVSGVQQVAPQVKAGLGNAQSLVGQEQKEMAPVQADVSNILAQPRPQVPQLGEIPQQPDQTGQQAKDLQKFLPLAIAFAGIAGGLSKQHVTTMFNAFGSAVKGFKQGQMDVFNENVKTFEENRDAMMQTNDQKLKAYEAVLSDRKGALDEKMAQLANIATQYHDPITYQMAISKDYLGIGQAMDQQRQLQQQLDMQFKQLDLTVKDTQQKFDLELAKYGLKTDDEGHIIPGQDASPQTVNGMKAQAARYYDQASQTADPDEKARMVARGDAITEAVKKSAATQPRSAPAMAVQKYMQEHPDASSDDISKFAATYQERVKAARDFGTGPLGNSARSLNTAVQHLDTARQAAEALNNGDVTALNKMRNAWKQQFGSDLPTNFDAIRQIVGQEVVKSIVPGGGGVGEREEAKNILSRANSPEQMSGAIAQIQKLMVGQLNSLRQQYQRTTSMDDFDQSFLMPETKEVMQRAGYQLQGSGGNSAPSGESATSSANQDDPLGILK